MGWGPVGMGSAKHQALRRLEEVRGAMGSLVRRHAPDLLVQGGEEASWVLGRFLEDRESPVRDADEQSLPRTFCHVSKQQQQ